MSELKVNYIKGIIEELTDDERAEIVECLHDKYRLQYKEEETLEQD